MKKTVVSTALLLTLATVVPAAAQQPNIKISFDGGRVTLAATDALISDVLAEWARVGGTVVTGADRLPSLKITLNLEPSAESDVLGALIGQTVGYGYVPRKDGPGPGTSHFEKIVIFAPMAPATASKPEADMSTPEARTGLPPVGEVPFDATPAGQVPYYKQPPLRPGEKYEPPVPERIFQYLEIPLLPYPGQEVKPEDPKPENAKPAATPAKKPGPGL